MGAAATGAAVVGQAEATGAAGTEVEVVGQAVCLGVEEGVGALGVREGAWEEEGRR